MKRRSHPRRRCSGFTLIEVLVAFALLASVLAVTLGVLSSGLSGTRRAEEYGRALFHAASQLALSGQAQAWQGGTQEGDTGDGYRWRTRASPLEEAAEDSAAGAVAPYAVTVTVWWGDAGRERSVELHSVRLGKRVW